MSDDDAPIPRGVSRDTLLDILAGWYEAGAAEEPAHTGTVADRTGHPDATARQTHFFEAIGALEPADDQRHRLTERGTPLAAAIADGEDDLARERAYGLLAAWPLTVRARDLLRGDPLGEDDLLPRLASFADADLDASRDRVGLRTLVDVWTWAGALDRADDGRYLPGRVDPGSGGGGPGTDAGGTADETVRVGLELSVDLDAEQVSELVAGVKRGLEAGEGPHVETSISGADVAVGPPGDTDGEE
ncbi:hypothetical protein [Haloglomus halophilum]|uniref:hypothetical protein n=1 Tax=Haloglomus halophilum TaxID=2962672 RepID=UPI0020CA1C1A|nr:hypothetical protein [Haloglomus halophilum]